jgi:hypothetical protein
VTIAMYLSELSRRLPRVRRGRILAEARAHLRDSASRHEADGLTRAVAEEAATHDFGDVSDVARRFAAEVAITETRLASALAFGSVLFFVFPLYVVPENTLPPATWTEKPVGILVLQTLSVALWVSAGVLAAASAALALTRWSHLTAPLLEGVLRTLGASILVSVLLVAHWATESSIVVLWPLVSGPLAFACLATCAEAAGWAHSRRCRLVRH